MTDGLVWYISIVARYNCSHFNYTHSTVFPIQYAGIILHSSSQDYISFSISFPQPNLVFTARCYASAILAMALCPPVRLSVCPSQVSVLLKRLNVGSHKQHHTIAQGLSFSDAKDLREIRPGSPPTRAPNAGVVGQNRWLLTNSRLYLENAIR